MAFPPKAGGFGAPAPNPLQAWARSKAPAPGAPPGHPGAAPGAPPPPGAPPGAPPAPAVTYPPGHQVGKVTPPGGASCSNCKFGMQMGDKTYCNEPNFVKAHGSAEIPSAFDSYVSDFWTPKEEAAAAPPPGAAAPGAPGAPPGGAPKPPIAEKGPTG